MSEYLVLARKYRSVTFDEVVGQEPIASTLKGAIKTGRIAHAYLFTGTRGVGKTTMARILAKALNCLSFDAPTPEPCNRCDACLAIGRGDDMDVVEIDGASNRGIDEIRDLRANAIFHPSRSRYKIYYIDEVHQITRDGFNALLKTLEEPPPHVKFIFATTEAEKVPATFLSRCQRFDFRNILTRLIAGHLAAICKAEKVEADGDALFRIARAAAGSMRDGLSLLDQILSGGEAVADADVIRILGTPPDERMLNIVQAVASGSSAQALGELSAVLEAGVALSSAVAALGDAFRNMMVAATCGAGSDLIELPESQKQAVGELAKRFSIPALVQAAGILQTTARNIRSSSMGRALVEAALVRLAEADKFIDPQSLIERLENLESPGGGSSSWPPSGDENARGAARGASGQEELFQDRQGPSKKNLTPGRMAETGSPPAGPGSASGPIVIEWNEPWLRANWSGVIDSLVGSRQMLVAGVLGPAKVVSFDGRCLKLGFEPAFENLRQRCAGPMAEAIDSALTAMAGREIRCQYVAGAGAVASAGAGLRPVFGGLSTEEKAVVMKDPSVQAVLNLFGGEVMDVGRNQSGLPAESEQGQADGGE